MPRRNSLESIQSSRSGSWSVDSESIHDSNDDNISQSLDSEYSAQSEECTNHNNSLRSICSSNGGRYVAIAVMPSNAPARRPRSRSRSNVDESERSTPSIYAGSDEMQDDDDVNSQEQQPMYERIDSREIEKPVQLSGRHRPSQFTGAIKRESRLNYSMKHQHSLKDSVKNVIAVNRLASLGSSSAGASADRSAESEPDYNDPGEEVHYLWSEVVDNLDSVTFKKIHLALEQAKKHILSKQSQSFLNQHLYNITATLLDQSPICLGRTKDVYEMTESDYVDKSIRIALLLINEQLRTTATKFSVVCPTAEALSPIFDYKNTYYQESEDPGIVRFDKIMVFQRIQGFYHLAIYFEIRANTPLFPDWGLVHRSLKASYEGIVYLRMYSKDDNNKIIHSTEEFVAKCRKESKALSAAVMKHMVGRKSDVFATIQVNKISTIVWDLKGLHLEYALTDDHAMVEYFGFVREMILKLLGTRSIPHKQFGQELLCTLIYTVHGLRDIPNAYTVSGSGLGFLVDGTYRISPSRRDYAGFVIPGADLMYEHVHDDTGKKIVLMFSTIDNDEKMWSLSEEHDDDPIPIEYTDFYTSLAVDATHFIHPPSTGWEAVDEIDDPPPTVESLPQIIQVREKHKILKQELATWFLENNVTNLVLDTKGSAAADATSVTNLIEAIDLHIMEQNNTVSPTLSNLMVTILPPLWSSSTKTITKKSMTCSKATLETAKLRLASAERWYQNTARMLLTAQTEYNSSTKELEAARNALKELEWLSRLGDDESLGETESESNTSSITHESSVVHNKPPRREQQQRVRSGLGGAARATLSQAVSGRRRRNGVL